MASLLAATCILVRGTRAIASAALCPIDGLKPQLKQVGGQSRMTFVSHDPGFLFPAIGGINTLLVNGAVVELRRGAGDLRKIPVDSQELAA